MSDPDRPAARVGPPADRPTGVLLYGMYDLRRLDRAPEVRIAAMTEGLARRIHTERIVGGRLGRAGKALRWLLGAGPRRVRAVYVEAPTANAMPTDLLFLALMRLLRKPVGVYFRDAYPLYRHVHPRSGRRQIVTDRLWLVSTALLKRVATVCYAPTTGLAVALKLPAPILLPPGTDPLLPDLGPGEPDVVVAVVQPGPRTGFDRLVEAVELVRRNRPAVRLRLGLQKPRLDSLGRLPEWVEVVAADRANLADVLRPGRVCVLPLPLNAYSELAVPVRLLDYLGFGKPVVATETPGSRAILEASGAGIATPDTAEGLAFGISRVLEDGTLAGNMARRARAYAVSEAQTWDARAATVLATLGILPVGASPDASGVPAASAAERHDL